MVMSLADLPAAAAPVVYPDSEWEPLSDDTTQADGCYPESDGEPMSDNTTHGDAMSYLRGAIEVLIADDPNAFAATDHLWYYQEGDPARRVAPDVFVVFGRPRRHRGGYRQWAEEGIAPQIVFEVVSPNNRSVTAEKLFLYESLGVEEYYVYDPGYSPSGDLDVARRSLRGFRRHAHGGVELLPDLIAKTSPRLGLGFGWDTDGLLSLIRPDGTIFPRYVEAVARADEAVARADEAVARADEAVARADAAVARADGLEATLARMRSAGTDAESINSNP